MVRTSLSRACHRSAVLALSASAWLAAELNAALSSSGGPDPLESGADALLVVAKRPELARDRGLDLIGRQAPGRTGLVLPRDVVAVAVAVLDRVGARQLHPALVDEKTRPLCA